MLRRLTNPHKAGSAVSDAPAGNPAEGRCTAGAVNPIQAKARALYAALGPCIWRTDNGGTVILSAEALKIIDAPLSHEALNA